MNVITHNGQFHADDVLAVTILDKLFKIKIVRTRDNKIINSNDDNNIVVDVGGIYDPHNNKFDHHQENCLATFEEHGKIPLSSSGMVYKTYGKQLILQYLKSADIKTNDQIVHDIYKLLYYNFLKEIDAIDNGIQQSRKIAYITTNSITAIISHINGDDITDDSAQLKKFKYAMKYMWITLKIKIKTSVNNILNYHDEKKSIWEAINNRHSVHPSGRIVVLNTSCNSWRRCLREYQFDGQIYFYIYKNGEVWNLGTVCKKRFIPHKLITNEEKYLPHDLIFVHKKQFIAGTKSLDSAIQMAINSL